MHVTKSFFNNLVTKILSCDSAVCDVIIFRVQHCLEYPLEIRFNARFPGSYGWGY